MTEKKYELTDELLEIDVNVETGSYTKLHRIRALRDFRDVNKGDLGGYIESEFNLAHEGDCWIYDDGKVYDDARVIDNAVVCDTASVNFRSRLCNNSIVKNNARVSGDAVLLEYACVKDNAIVNGNAMIRGNAQVSNFAHIYDHSVLFGNCRVFDTAKVCGNSDISGNAIINGDVMIKNEAKISGDAIIHDSKDYIVIKGLGIPDIQITFLKAADKKVYVNFMNRELETLEQFKRNVKVIKFPEQIEHELLTLIDLAEYHFSPKE